MAIFKSISSISNVKVSMKSNLISSFLTPDAGFGNEATSCFGGGLNESCSGGCGGGNSNINIIDLDINSFGRHRRCC